jgi:hypothetical protein
MLKTTSVLARKGLNSQKYGHLALKEFCKNLSLAFFGVSAPASRKIGRKNLHRGKIVVFGGPGVDFFFFDTMLTPPASRKFLLP